VRRVAELAALREAKKTRVKPVGQVRMEAAEAAPSGALVMAAEDITKAWGERVVVRNFTTRILKGDLVGVVGANGAGKTTLLNLLIGKLQPDSGSVKLGSNIAMASLDQMRATHAKADTARYYALNIEFHDLLLRGAGNPKAKTMYDNLVKEMHLFRRKGLSIASNIARSIEEHETITKAVAIGDAEAARSAALDHIIGGFGRYITMIEASPANG
jgi:ATPase subunit of ABC transporter with duplicated ATPase domains